MGEWKPGDVAMFPSGRAIVFHRGDPDASAADNLAWMFADGSDMDLQPASFARPLVVIDPESVEQVEQFARMWCAAFKYTWPVSLTRAQTALREFASPTPPKPDEPLGLGAVVVDSDDRIWIHDPTTTTTHNWHSRGVGRAWHNVDAVRVLSDGYEVPEPLADWERDLLRGQS